MRLGRKARTAEAKVGRAVDTLVARLVGTSPRQPLDVMHALLEDIERQVQPAGRGTWVFPFTRVTVNLLALTREARAQLAGVVGDPESLRNRIAEKLAPACRLGPLEVRIRFRSTPGELWSNADYHLEFERREQPQAAAPAPVAKPISIELTVTNGVADRRRFTFTTDRIDIGRGVEVLDSRQRLLRRNQIAFSDQGHDANQTVSRRHAHVLYREPSREYRVYDDTSARGTSIIRKGTTIPVPSGSRGVALQSEDELILGQARLRVKIGEGALGSGFSEPFSPGSRIPPRPTGR